MPVRIHIINRIVSTVRIQVQSVPVVGVFVEEPADCGVIESCPEVVLAGQWVVLLTYEAEAVRYVLCICKEVTEGVILVVVVDITVLIRQVRGASQLVRCVVIIRLGFFAVGADQLIAAYVADGVVVIFFTDYLITIKDNGYKSAIFLEFCSKSLAVIAVLLDVSVTVPVTCKNPCKICFANGFLPYCTTLFHGLSSKC